MKKHDLNPRHFAWIIIVVMFSVSLVLSCTSAYNYTEIAKARILLDFSASGVPTIELDSEGHLESVNMTMHFNIENPSSKELRVWILTFKSWVRDLPLEDDVSSVRWMIDGTLPTEDGDRKYYPVFSTSYSFDSPIILLEPNSNITITRHLVLDMDTDSTIMQNVMHIYNYSRSVGAELQWYYYGSAIVFIQGIEPYSGPDNDAHVIRRTDGFDLTPGTGGVGT